MLDKLKQMRELKALNDSLAQEKESVEKEGIKVVINGKLNIEKIQLNPELEKEEEERIVKECLNEAIKKIQMTAAKKMSQIQGFGA
jgi:DNA-binding protein YbaB